MIGAWFGVPVGEFEGAELVEEGAVGKLVGAIGGLDVGNLKLARLLLGPWFGASSGGIVVVGKLVGGVVGYSVVRLVDGLSLGLLVGVVFPGGSM